MVPDGLGGGLGQKHKEGNGMRTVLGSRPVQQSS